MARDISWQQLWRVVDGVVALERAFSYDDDPDWLHFELDPNSSMWVSDDDPRIVHVDAVTEGKGIFLDVDEARRYAIAWLEAQVRVYQMRIASLRSGQ